MPKKGEKRARARLRSCTCWSIAFLVLLQASALAETPPKTREETTQAHRPARKLSDRAKARAAPLFREGVQAYDQGSYLYALEKFRQAYRIYPSPKILARIGDCYAELGRRAKAYATYRRFLEETEHLDEDPVYHRNRVKIRAALRRLRQEIAIVRIRITVPGAKVVVSGRQPTRAPLDREYLFDPGTMTVTVTKPGFYPYERTAQLRPGELLRIHVDRLVPVAGQPATRASHGAPWWKKWWFWTAVGSAAVGLAVGLGVWYGRREVDQSADSQESDVNLGPASFPGWW